MKIFSKIFLILAVALFVCRSSPDAAVFGASTNDRYARIEADGANLYTRNEITGVFTPVTDLPKTYFVRIEDDTDGEYYRVSYGGLFGFIKKTAVEEVDFEPLYKTADAQLTVAADVPAVYLRSRPDHRSDNVVAEISRGETLSYYGKITGTIVSYGGSDEWFFVSYQIEGTGEPVRGYLYGEYVTVVPVVPNPGGIIVKEDPPSQEPPDDSSDSVLPPLSAPPQYIHWIIISALSVPALVIMFLLFQKPKERKRKTWR